MKKKDLGAAPPRLQSDTEKRRLKGLHRWLTKEMPEVLDAIGVEPAKGEARMKPDFADLGPLVAKDCWADADEREAMVNEIDRWRAWHADLSSASWDLLRTYLRPTDPTWCGCCASHMDMPGHKSGCAAAALVRVLSRRIIPDVPKAPNDV